HQLERDDESENRTEQQPHDRCLDKYKHRPTHRGIDLPFSIALRSTTFKTREERRKEVADQCHSINSVSVDSTKVVYSKLIASSLEAFSAITSSIARSIGRRTLPLAASITL